MGTSRRGGGTRLALLALTHGLLFAGAGACGIGFSGSDCMETRTCPLPRGEGGEGGAAARGEAGDAGEAMIGGQAGQGGEPEGRYGSAFGTDRARWPTCQKQADCDDGLACNGVEVCVEAGVCVPGVAPTCHNADSAHCEVQCVEERDGFACRASARDGDGDGFGTTLCVEAPGDDCDDANEGAHPGAAELCDRLDNDCDGKLDLDDGLSLVAEHRAVGQDLDSGVSAEGAAMAWSEAAQLFGLFWRETGSDWLVFAAYDARGERRLGPTVVAQYAAARVAIAGGGAGFAVAWPTQLGGVQLRTIDERGRLGSLVTLSEREGSDYAGLALGYSPQSQRWAVIADHGVATVGPGETHRTFTHVFNRALVIRGVSVVAAAGGFVVAFGASDGTRPDPRAYRFSAELDGMSPVAFENPQAGFFVKAVAGPDEGFAIVVAPAPGGGASSMQLFDAHGAPTCQGMVKAAIVDAVRSERGYTLATRGSGSTALSLSELTRECRVVPQVSAVVEGAVTPSIVASPTSYGLLWANDAAGGWSYSIFGSSYCDRW